MILRLMASQQLHIIRNFSSPAQSHPWQSFLAVLSLLAILFPPERWLQSSEWDFVYQAQAGDTPAALAARFRVRLEDVQLSDPAGANQLLPPGQVVIIHGVPAGTQHTERLLPDSEVIYSPSARDFDINAYVEQAGGFLSTHREYLRSTGWTSAAEVVKRVALENSINPRLLLALLEYRCGCVLGKLPENVDPDFLMGISSSLSRGLYRQLGWSVNQLSLGYYGWRNGLITDFILNDGSIVALAPDLNAGSVAVEYLLAQLVDRGVWKETIEGKAGFQALFRTMFGDPWVRARQVEPLYPAQLIQPELSLPFTPGKIWGFTSGPHRAWETNGALAALDFAPGSIESGCINSKAWVVAVASGVIVRSRYGAVVLDLDGDGYEQTGWSILYMHIASLDRVSEGAVLKAGDLIGHPSCEGGPASGTHVHIARKFNGEWIAADGPLPFVMDGWVPHAGFRPYVGTLTRQGKIVVASPSTPAESFISRPISTDLSVLHLPRNSWLDE
jgi:murein DD-endopeptidase MepM/ murein hydrolase activator NlpD